MAAARRGRFFRKSLSFPTLWEGISLYQKPKERHARTMYWVYALALLFYAGLTLWGSVHHEPWRDEGNQWLMAREISIPYLFTTELRYGGSPGLWHLMLAPLAQAGFPIEAQQYLHWFLACVFAGIFLFFSPFHLLIKLLFIFSYYVLYQHAVIVRVYLLSWGLTFCLCALYRQRMERPLLYGGLMAMLANSSVFGLFVAMCLGLRYAWETYAEGHYKPHRLLALACMVAGGLFSVYTIYPPRDAEFYYTVAFPFHEYARIGKTFAIGLTPFLPTHTSIQSFLSAIPGLLLCAAALFYTYGRKTRWLSFFFAANVVWLLYLMVFRYIWAAERHYSFMLLFLMATLWLFEVERSKKIKPVIEKPLAILLVLALCVSTWSGASAILKDVYGFPFAGGKDMATYLEDNHFSDKVVVAYPPFTAMTVLSFLPHWQFWLVHPGMFASYLHVTNTTYLFFTPDKLYETIKQQFPGQEVYLLGTYREDISHYQGFELIHNAPGVMDWLCLYRVRPSLPE
jgi:hypothetical protein